MTTNPTSNPMADPSSNQRETSREPSPPAHFGQGISAAIGLDTVATRIAESRLWLTLALLGLAMTIGGYRVGNRYGLVMGFFAATALIALVFFYDSWRLLHRFPSDEIEARDAWGLNALAARLAKRLGHPAPRLREIESETPFLFSAGLFPSRLQIFVSSALARKLEPDELAAVLALELSRSRLGLTRTTTAAVAAVDLFLVLTGTLDAALALRFLLRRRLRRVCLGPFTWLAMAPATLFLRLVIRRGSTLMADQHAAGNALGHAETGAETLARALTKLDSYAKTRPVDASLAEAALFTVDPLSHYDFSRWTSTRARLESRVRALLGRYPA